MGQHKVKFRVESRERQTVAVVRVSALSDPSGQTRGLARPPPGTRSELTQLHFLTFIGASGQEWKSQRTVLKALLGPCPSDTTISLSSCCPAPRPTPNLAGKTHTHTHTHTHSPSPGRMPAACLACPAESLAFFSPTPAKR